MTDALSLSARSLPELPPSSRYELLFKLASGGMASVYVGRLRGAGGFWRLVAIKKAHAHLMEDASFRRMLVEEARLASRIHHPNVVPVLDVEQVADHLLLVMDYVEGASLAELLAANRGQPLAPRLAVRIALDACAGLAAAHDLRDAAGHPLHIVHRDVSPQNLLVGVDGLARLTDFGIAKSAYQGATTTTGALKGKLSYMAPEYVDGKPPDQRCDVFGLGVVIWEALANRRLFRGDSEVDTLKRVVEAKAPLLSTVAPWVGAELDPVLAAALAKDPDERFTSAKALGNALEIAARRSDLVGSAEEVGAHVRALFADTFEERRRFIHRHVATDAGPTSGRPTSPMPQARPASPEAETALEAPRPADRLPSAPDEPVAARTARTAPRHLAATVNDPDGAASAPLPVPAPAPPSDRSDTTLDGSGVSRPDEDASGAPSRSPRRTLWLLAAVGLVVGGLAAVGVHQLGEAPPEDASADGASAGPSARSAPPMVTLSSQAPSAPDPSAAPSGAAAAEPTVVPSRAAAPAPEGPSTTEHPGPSAAASSPARSSGPAGAPVPSAPATAPSATSSKPPAKPGATGTAFVPPETIPANPYGTKQ